MKIGDVVEGRYRILKTLGQGGMGTVFLAEHALIKRRVAIKILHQDLATDAAVIERFMNEARAAGTLGHPNIVESTDMGFTGNQVPYIVFEYLEGTLLTDEIYRVGGLPVRRAMRIAEQIINALGAAHSAGIVHRDLKSDNVFLTDKDDALDHVKVLDFGISRFLEVEEQQRVLGTPEFMAPEQITAPASVDKRADIYSFGVMLYEMLTARRPFSGDDRREVMQSIVRDVVPPLHRPEVPQALQDLIITKLLAKDPAERFQTMAEVHAAIEPFNDAMPRRRSGRMAAVQPPIATDVARDSALMPRPSHTRNTPVPGTIDPFPGAVHNVALPQPEARRPYALYAVAGLGVVVGILGLAIGLKGSKAEKVAQLPPPVAQPAAAMPLPKEPAKISVDLDADAPNAHVVFRRRVMQAPEKMQITATDVVELVEVSAPGYKTQRYWLTFDRPTHLKAHLVKGSGSLEATEEETLIALGEVQAPTPTIAAAAPVAAPAPQLATVARPASAPAAVTAPAATPTAMNASASTSAAKLVEAAPPHVDAPTPAPPQVAEAPAMAPRKIGRAAAEAETAPEQIAATEPAVVTEPTPAPAPPVEAPKPEEPKPAIVAEPAPVRPAIDSATVSSVIGQHRPEVLKCFAEGKKKDHAMKGTLALQLQVDATGKVNHIQVQSTLGSPLVAACVVKSANAWRFPSRGGADVATVNYPFTIN